MGELLYRNAVAEVGWNKRYLPVLFPGVDPRPLTVAFLLAREYGDHTTERRLARKLAGFENSRFFDAEGGADQDEFGHFFKYGERYPRGQESALYLLKDLLEGEGDWWRAFNEPDRGKFTAPTVTDAEYPKLGFSVARNDETSGVLELESYAATSSARGQATRFSVRNLPDPSAAHVRRDGAQHAGWRATGASSIEIETTIDTHRYQIYTGYRGSLAKPSGETPETLSAGVAGARRRSRAHDGDRSVLGRRVRRRRGDLPLLRELKAWRSRTTWRTLSARLTSALDLACAPIGIAFLDESVSYRRARAGSAETRGDPRGADGLRAGGLRLLDQGAARDPSRRSPPTTRTAASAATRTASSRSRRPRKGMTSPRSSSRAGSTRPRCSRFRICTRSRPPSCTDRSRSSRSLRTWCCSGSTAPP